MTNAVILTRNRPRLLHQCMESLVAHTDPEAYNLVLVDDASDNFCEGPDGWPYGLPRPKHSSFLRAQNSGHVLAQLKNLGVAWSEQRFGRGEWLYIGDADTWFSKGWLSDLMHNASHSEEFRFCLWGGQVHPFHQINSTLHIDDDVAITEHCAIDGPSWLMRWSTWDTFGPLARTTEAGTCKGEDGAFGDRIRAAGYKLGCIQPHVVIHTGLRNTEGELAVGADIRAQQRIQDVIYE